MGRDQDSCSAYVNFHDNTSEVYAFGQIEELRGKTLEQAVVGQLVTVYPDKRNKKEVWKGTLYKVSGEFIVTLYNVVRC
jgi:hypothetical protein